MLTPPPASTRCPRRPPTRPPCALFLGTSPPVFYGESAIGSARMCVYLFLDGPRANPLHVMRWICRTAARFLRESPGGGVGQMHVRGPREEGSSSCRRQRRKERAARFACLSALATLAKKKKKRGFERIRWTQLHSTRPRSATCRPRGIVRGGFKTTSLVVGTIWRTGSLYATVPCMEPAASILAANVIRLRGDRSQYWLAEAAGISRRAVRSVELCENPPTLSTLVAIARALGVPVAELFLAKRRSTPVTAPVNTRLQAGLAQA